MNTPSSYRNFLRELKAVFCLALPLITAQLIQSGSGFIGTAMIGHLGEDELAASGLVGSCWFVLIVVFFGILNAISVLVSQYHGANQPKRIGQLISQSFLLCVLMGVPIMLGMWYLPILFAWTGQSAQVITFSGLYLHSLVWCTPGLMALIVMEQFLIGLGRTRLVLIISLIQVPVEIFANYVFIYGKFGIPAFGIAGLGWGFTSVFTIAPCLIGWYLHKASAYKPYKIYAYLNRWRLEDIKEICRMGWPIGLSYGVEVAAFGVMAFIMGRISTEVLAANQITMQYLGLGLTMVFSISQTASVRVGEAAGKNDRSTLIKAYQACVALGLIFMTALALAYWIFPTALISLDLHLKTAKPQVIEEATIFLAIGAIFQMFDAIRVISAGALRGLRETQYVLKVSTLCFWLVGIGLGLLAHSVFHLGAAYLWWAMTLAIATGAFLLYRRWTTLSREINLVEMME